MNESESQDELSRLLRKTFNVPLPPDTRRELHQELRTARLDWQTKARTQHPFLALFAAHPRIIWTAACVGLLAILFVGARWMGFRSAGRNVAATMSYACATAHYPASSACCIAVFYSKDDPTEWVERRMLILDSQGKVTTITAKNQNRS